MGKIHIIARFRIHNMHLAPFKEGANRCIALTKNEPGAIVYDWFVDEENMLCTVVETYNDSEAVQAHVGNVNEELAKLMAISDFSAEVFGDASPELSVALKDMGIVPVSHFNGL